MSAGVSYGGINAPGEYTGASLGGITLYTRSGASWVNGYIDGEAGSSIFFSSEYGNIKQIVMSGFNWTDGDLIGGWSQTNETTITWSQDPEDPTNTVYLLSGNSLSLSPADPPPASSG